MSSNRDFRPDSIENGDESYSSSEESLSNCCAISVNTKVQELQQSFENLKTIRYQTFCREGRSLWKRDDCLFWQRGTSFEKSRINFKTVRETHLKVKYYFYSECWETKKLKKIGTKKTLIFWFGSSTNTHPSTPKNLFMHW